jgi:hypothetical protein
MHAMEQASSADAMPNDERIVVDFGWGELKLPKAARDVVGSILFDIHESLRKLAEATAQREALAKSARAERTARVAERKQLAQERQKHRAVINSLNRLVRQRKISERYLDELSRLELPALASLPIVPLDASTVVATARPLSVAVICGVYFLVEESRIVYVGQSTNVLARIQSHTDKRFDAVAVLPVAAEHLDAMEAYYIDRFTPALNGSPGRRKLLENTEAMASMLVRYGGASAGA